MSKTWTAADSAAASAEAWGIFDVNGEMQLQRLDDPQDRDEPPFKNDGEAWHHVVFSAKNGGALHQRALEFLQQQSPAEHARIMEDTNA